MAERLPPKTLIISLPALTVAEAAAIIQLIDSLHHLLWEEYGEAVVDLYALDHAESPGPQPDDPDDWPPF